MLSEKRAEPAAEAFFNQAVGNNGVPWEVVIDKSNANQASLLNLNILLWLLDFWALIETLQVKYLNNIIEQDHRSIKKNTKPVKGIEIAHMI